MKTIKAILCFLLAAALALCLSGCASVPILQGSSFPAAYRHFIRHMRQQPPVSVAFEQYAKAEGYREDKLIVETDAVTIRALTEALAEVKITEKLPSASSFAVRYYAFTDKDGNTFTFEFYGSCLKVEESFYQTENTEKFISIRPQARLSGEYLAALDEAYDGKGDYLGKMFIACRLLEEQDGVLQKTDLGDFELSEKARILAPVSASRLDESASVQADAFFANFEQVKGQENANYIFHITLESGILVSLRYDAALSASHQL